MASASRQSEYGNERRTGAHAVSYCIAGRRHPVLYLPLWTAEEYERAYPDKQHRLAPAPADELFLLCGQMTGASRLSPVLKHRPVWQARGDGHAEGSFYERKGDASGTGGYLGYPYKHGLRYQFRYGNSVKLGFVASQDAGEPFFGGRNTMGYDFYSFYLQVKNLGRWKNITLGRYRLNVGLGLILNNDFGFGKLSALTSLGRSSSCIIRGHSSCSSANYLHRRSHLYLIKGPRTDWFSFLSPDRCYACC